MNVESRFEGFDHPIDAVVKFLATTEFFTLMLKNGEIVHFSPDDPAAFRKWLRGHRVPDIREDWEAISKPPISKWEIR